MVAVSGPSDTLVLLVTCSRDESRKDLAVAVTKNLAALIPQAGLQDSFVIFDNASSFDDHLAFAPAGTTLVRSQENVGYWSAIRWVLQRRAQLLGREHKYIYLVESDLAHSDLRPLGLCEAFLAQTNTASSVRTQEFSVRWRFLYEKRLKMLPFHVTRSEIHLHNAVSHERAWFKKVDGFSGIYLSNLHPKLPALNRLEAMDRVFDELARKGSFTEHDFFVEMGRLYPFIGVYDGGLFHSLISREDKHALCGSYSSAKVLQETGYQTTRKAQMLPVPDTLFVSKVPA